MQTVIWYKVIDILEGFAASTFREGAKVKEATSRKQNESCLGNLVLESGPERRNRASGRVTTAGSEQDHIWRMERCEQAGEIVA
jgi:hypothetical protein